MEHLCYFFMALTLYGKEVEDRSVAIRQFLDGCGYDIGGQTLGIGRLFWDIRDIILGIDKRHFLLCPQRHQSLVDDDARHPGFQRPTATILERTYRSEYLDESLLQYVMQIGLLGDITEADTGEVVGIMGIQHIHSTGITPLKKLKDVLFYVHLLKTIN